MYSSSRLISASISPAGRCQFSWLKANRREHADPGVEAALDHLPHRAHPGVVAQRPRQRAALGPAAVAVHDDRDVGRHRAVHPQPLQEVVAHPSDFHDLGFFGVDQAVDLLDVLVGELLDVLLGARLVVLGDLLELLDLATCVSVRACRTAIRPSSASLWTTFTSSLRRSSRQRRQRHPDQVALSGGVEAEVGRRGWPSRWPG